MHTTIMSSASCTKLLWTINSLFADDCVEFLSVFLTVQSQKRIPEIDGHTSYRRHDGNLLKLENEIDGEQKHETSSAQEECVQAVQQRRKEGDEESQG